MVVLLLAHGGRNSSGKKTVTLRTQIARAPGRPATGRSTTPRIVIWIRETKVWGRRYERGMESEV